MAQMREILFRGKTEDGEWVEGFYLVRKLRYKGDKSFMFERATISTGIIESSGGFGERTECLEFEVIPETVGQYTGLTDKNGKKIFEGDIISEKPPMNEIAYIGYVAYDEEAAVWRFMINNDTKFNGVLLGTYSRSYTVIGNIHDNPELLKGDKNDKNNNL